MTTPKKVLINFICYKSIFLKKNSKYKYTFYNQRLSAAICEQAARQW